MRNGRFCCFCSVHLISAAFGGRKSRKSKGPWKWLPEKERTLGNGRLCCFCGVPSFQQLSAAGNPENLKSPGNGFRKRSEHWEMDDVAAFVGFPSFRQLSAAGNPENLSGLEMGRRFCCFWGSPHFGSFRRQEIQKIQGALEMASEHWEMDDFAAFVVFPSFRQLSAAGNPENPRGPGNGFRKRSEHCEMDDFATFVGFPSFRQGILRNGRFCCFCGVPLTSAAFGDRKSRKSKGG